MSTNDPPPTILMKVLAFGGFTNAERICYRLKDIILLAVIDAI